MLAFERFFIMLSITMARKPSSNPHAATTVHLPRTLMEQVRDRFKGGKKLRLFWTSAVLLAMRASASDLASAEEEANRMLLAEDEARRQLEAGKAAFARMSEAAAKSPKQSRREKQKG